MVLITKTKCIIIIEFNPFLLCHLCWRIPYVSIIVISAEVFLTLAVLLSLPKYSVR